MGMELNIAATLVSCINTLVLFRNASSTAIGCLQASKRSIIRSSELLSSYVMQAIVETQCVRVLSFIKILMDSSPMT